MRNDLASGTGLAMAAVALSLSLAGCATQSVVGARDALHGQDLQTAINLYGRFDERVSYGGASYYVWRKAVAVEGAPHVCELRVELGYRNIIRDTVLEGYAPACGMFSVTYSSDRNAPRKDAERKTAPGGVSD